MNEDKIIDGEKFKLTFEHSYVSINGKTLSSDEPIICQMIYFHVTDVDKNWVANDIIDKLVEGIKIRLPKE